MLAIGRALMTNPRLLVLDEATEGLAPLVVAEIWRTVAAIRATGIATLIVDRVDFRQGPLFAEWRAIVGPFFAAPPQVEHFELVHESA
jgi:energy-coupling factor transporter ATP-binding protein EcfA2